MLYDIYNNEYKLATILTEEINYLTIEEYEAPAECEHVYVYMNCTLCGAANPHFIPNLLVAGENKVICNEYHLVDTTGHGNPYQFVLLTVGEDGLYTFTSDKLMGITIFTTEITDPDADFTAITGESWKVYTVGQAELKAGTYYIGFIYVEGVGEYTVNIDKHEHNFVEGKCECGEIDPNYVPPHEHNFVEGKCECGETDPNYVAPHEHVFVEGKCECGETDPNYVAPHEHVFVEGKCECGEEDPDYVAPQPPVDEDPKDEPTDEPTEEPKLGFFDKIMKAIKDFFGKIMAFFKGMFKF
jgi:hypothetical protein